LLFFSLRVALRLPSSLAAVALRHFSSLAAKSMTSADDAHQIVFSELTPPNPAPSAPDPQLLLRIVYDPG